MNVTLPNTKKTIIITQETDNSVTVNASGGILPEFIQMAFSAIEAMCKESLNRVPQEDVELRKAIEEDMYEMINLGASGLLSRAFPAIEMRPDLTVEALAEAENKLLEDPNNVERYVEGYSESFQAKKDAIEHQKTEVKHAKRKK